MSLFSNRFFYWFFRTETFRPEPVFFQLSSYNVLFTAAEAAQNHHLNFTQNNPIFAASEEKPNHLLFFRSGEILALYHLGGTPNRRHGSPVGRKAFFRSSKVEVVILGSFCCGEKHIVGGQLKEDRFWPKGFGSEKPIKKTVRKKTHMGSR